MTVSSILNLIFSRSYPRFSPLNWTEITQEPLSTLLKRYHCDDNQAILKLEGISLKKDIDMGVIET